jgi:hypothetical protein
LPEYVKDPSKSLIPVKDGILMLNPKEWGLYKDADIEECEVETLCWSSVIEFLKVPIPILKNIADKKNDTRPMNYDPMHGIRRHEKPGFVASLILFGIQKRHLMDSNIGMTSEEADFRVLAKDGLFHGRIREKILVELTRRTKELSGGVSATPQTTSSSVVLFVPSKGGALRSKKIKDSRGAGVGAVVITKKDRSKRDFSSRKRAKVTKELSELEEEDEFEDYDSREDSDFIPEDPLHTPVYKNDQVYIQSLIDIIKTQNQQLESLKVEYFTIYRY